MSVPIKIRLESYDHKQVDEAAERIVSAAKRAGARVSGPIAMPTHIEKFTVQSSPHVDKKAREQFEIRTHKRVIFIKYPTKQIIESLMKVDLPAGVNVEIKTSDGE